MLSFLFVVVDFIYVSRPSQEALGVATWWIILFRKIIYNQSYCKIVLLVYANIFYFCKSSTNIFLSSMKGVCVCVFVWALLSAPGALQSTHVFVCVFVSLGHRKIFYYCSFTSHLRSLKCSNKCKKNKTSDF